MIGTLPVTGRRDQHARAHVAAARTGVTAPGSGGMRGGATEQTFEGLDALLEIAPPHTVRAPQALSVAGAADGRLSLAGDRTRPQGSSFASLAGGLPTEQSGSTKGPSPSSRGADMKPYSAQPMSCMQFLLGASLLAATSDDIRGARTEMYVGSGPTSCQKISSIYVYSPSFKGAFEFGYVMLQQLRQPNPCQAHAVQRPPYDPGRPDVQVWSGRHPSELTYQKSRVSDKDHNTYWGTSRSPTSPAVRTSTRNPTSRRGPRSTAARSGRSSGGTPGCSRRRARS
ncbi:MAG: hypothetical protein JWN22_3077 [Nocardioides sp.]|nr:hypothetical protein [Nocardioides sp.]